MIHLLSRKFPARRNEASATVDHRNADSWQIASASCGEACPNSQLCSAQRKRQTQVPIVRGISLLAGNRL
jgi:hypothetical protein